LWRDEAKVYCSGSEGASARNPNGLALTVPLLKETRWQPSGPVPNERAERYRKLADGPIANFKGTGTLSEGYHELENVAPACCYVEENGDNSAR
jgi:hypothetical protein